MTKFVIQTRPVVRGRDPLAMPLALGVAAGKNPASGAAEHIVSYVKLHDMHRTSFQASRRKDA